MYKFIIPGQVVFFDSLPENEGYQSHGAQYKEYVRFSILI